MASGHVNRIKRPNTWLHRPMLQNREESSCQPGAVHTWHQTDVPTAPHHVCYQGQSRKHLLDASISPFDPNENWTHGRRGVLPAGTGWQHSLLTGSSPVRVEQRRHSGIGALGGRFARRFDHECNHQVGNDLSPKSPFTDGIGGRARPRSGPYLVLTVSDAEAQTVGMERRQERRAGRHERREVRRAGRHERREVRRTGTTTGTGTTTRAAK